MNKFEKTIKQLTQLLDNHEITYEVLGDKTTFAIATNCTIHTNQCTIDVFKTKITVNEKEVEDVYEAVASVLEVEQP